MSLLISSKITVHLGDRGLVVPDEEVLTFLNAGHKRVLLKAFFKNKTVETHVALRKLNNQYVVYFGKQFQKELGIFPSDFFEIQFIENTTKYGVVIPDAFKAVLESDPEGAFIFESLTDGKKRSLIYHIKRYKSEQTQVDKTLLIFDNLKRGIRDQRELIKA